MQQSKTNIIPKISFLWLLLTMSMVFSLNAAPIRIMPLGDSITEGVAEIPTSPDQNISEYPVSNGLTLTDDKIAYRGELWDLLKAGNYEIDFVGSKNTGSSYPTTDFDTDHEGHGGFSTTNIKDNIVGYLDNNTPDIVLLHIGTNNMTLAAVDDVESILTTIFTKNANAKVFVARIIENERGTGLTRVTTTDFNDAVAAMVGTHVNTASIQMVNMQTGAGLVYDPAGLPNDMQPFHADDNISDYHPNAKGYAKMATKWYDALVASDWLNLTPSTPNASTGKNHLWKLDEVSGPFSDTTSSVDATCVTTSCPITATGKVGKALDFTGTGNRFLKTTVGSYNADDNYTIAFWMKPETNANRDVMVHIGDLWIGRTNTNLEIELKSGTSSIVGTLILNAWNHVVLVKEGTNAARTYVNGTLSNTQVNTGASKIAGETFIGTHTLGSFQYKGLLDEVSIYNTALTDAEVQTMYSVGADTTDTEAPVIVEVTAVQAETNDTTPSYTFSSTETGNITYAGSCASTTTVATVGNNTIIFNALTEGTYDDCTIAVTDDASNTSNILAVTSFEVNTTTVVADTTAPVIAEVTAVQVETNDTTPNYTFSSTETGNITYAGSCASTTTVATVGNNTIIFNALTEGIYDDCTIAVTDDASNTSNILAVTSFEVNTTTVVADTTAPVITLTGANPQQLAVGATYTELGATVTDNVDAGLVAIIDASAVDVNAEGNYTVTYNVSDAAGNAATEVNRTVVMTAPIDVNDTNTTDIDGDGIADENDLDIDGDGVNNENDAFPEDKNENSDTDGDGIGDIADLDDDNNGIPDTEDQTWMNYNANTKTAIVKGSEIKAVGLDVMPSVSGGFLTLKHVFGTQEVYVSVKESGELRTGFKNNGVDDSTLKNGTFFKAGTKSAIMKDANEVSIRTIAKFNKNETFEIGGK